MKHLQNRAVTCSTTAAEHFASDWAYWSHSFTHQSTNIFSVMLATGLGKSLSWFFLLMFFPTCMGVNKPSFKVTLNSREAQGLKAEILE